MAGTQVAGRGSSRIVKFPQPDANLKSFKLSSGGARYAWFARSWIRQTKGRWGSGYGPDGLLGAPLTLEWVQLQVISEGLKTKPSQWLTVKRDDPKLWDKIGEWVGSEKFGSVGGPRVYREWYAQTPKKTGKAVDVCQEVPTPQGWRRFGDLQVGDEVFDEHGQPTKVTAVSPVWLGRPCYLMKLTDGAEVVSDRDHEWVTEDPAGRRKSGRYKGVVETREIAETLKWGDSSNHSIVYPSGPLNFEPLVDELPVAPYTLGAWLGDGTSADGSITSIDEEVIARIRLDGYEVVKVKARQRWGIQDIKTKLRDIGVLNNKHIPEIYKRASASDRLEILRGLMDTDGTVSVRNKGTAELALSDPILAADAEELIRSLGFAPRVAVGAAYLNGERKKDRHRISFRCWSDRPNPFHLSRKTSRISNEEPTRRARSRRRHIVGCEPCESVPVRCIEVENETGLFLIGRTLLITHNSTLSSSLGIYFTGYDGEPGAEVYALAASKTNAKTVFDQARYMILKSPRLMDEFKVYKDVIEHERSGSVFRVLAADADYNEGFNPHAVIIDELHVHKSREMYDALTSHLHTGAREDPIAITITNAGDDEESICYEVYSQGRAVIDGLPDARTDLYAWIPELEPSEIYDPSKWAKVMPMSWQTVPAMQEAQRKFPEYVFLRRYLNVWTEAELGWLPYEFWADAEEKDIVVPKVPIVLAGDLGMTKDTTALAWAGVVEECVCGVGNTERDPTEHYEECHFGEVVVGSHIWGIKQRDRAKSPPCHELLKGDRFPIKLLRNYVEDVIRPQWEILEFVYDKWMLEQLAQELSDEGLNMAEFAQTDQRMIPASEDLWNVITRDDLLRHPGDPILTKHVMAGVVDETARGWRINKKKTKKPCDGLIAMLMATHRALHYFRTGTPGFEML